MYLETVIARWIFHREKSTLTNDRKGNCGFALAALAILVRADDSSHPDS
jgi:hypothetical protein